MSHDHGHHGHSQHLEPAQGNRNAFFIGICLNLAFVLVEVIAGFVYDSVALFTDAGHNASDVASLVLSLMAFYMSRKKSTSTFTYGFKKTTVLAALANAVILLVAIGILGYESIQRLFKPVAVQGNNIAWIAAIGIVINGISALLFFRHKEKELNAKSAYLHLLADTLVSVGVLAAGILISYTHWYWLDPMIGLAIIIVILFSTLDLLKDSFRMSIDAVPLGIELENIKQVVLKTAHVKKVWHVHVWPISTSENALTAHVEIDNALSFPEKLEVIKKIRHELMHHDIHHSTIEISENAG